MTRSPTDEYIPEFGYTPNPHRRQIPRSVPKNPGSTLVAKDGNDSRYKPYTKVPDPKSTRGMITRSMSRTMALAKVPSTRTEQNAKVAKSMSTAPVRNGTNDHVHFEKESVRSVHDHLHDRPPTPYPAS